MTRPVGRKLTFVTAVTTFLAFAAAHGAGTSPDSTNAGYNANFEVNDNTYTQIHRVSYAKLDFHGLSIASHDKLERKTVLTDDDVSIQQQGDIGVTAGYEYNDRLRFNGILKEALLSDDDERAGQNEYSFQGVYEGADSSFVSQALGSVSEERFGFRDWGVKYVSSGRYLLTDKRSGAVFDVRGRYADDNLAWGQTEFGGKGRYSREYAPGSKIRFSYEFNRKIKQDAASVEADPYTITSTDHDAKAKLGYKIGRTTRLSADCRYILNGIASDNRTGYVFSVDSDTRELILNTDIRRLRLGILKMDGGVTVSGKRNMYPDPSYNDNSDVFAVRGSGEIDRGALDGLYVRGNYRKGVLKSESEEDDRDDILTVASAGIPVPFNNTVGCTLVGDVNFKKTVYIHTSRSLNSRWNRSYRLTPVLEYYLAPGVVLRQSYGLSARYIEYLIKDYYPDSESVVGLADRLTREFEIGNELTASLPRLTLRTVYDFDLEEKSRYEGGLFESVFRRMPTSLKGSHKYSVSVSWRAFPRLSLMPFYAYDQWHEDELEYSEEKGRIRVDERRLYRKHTARFMLSYMVGKGNFSLSSVYVFKNLDGEYDEKKLIRFTAYLPLL